MNNRLITLRRAMILAALALVGAAQSARAWSQEADPAAPAEAAVAWYNVQDWEVEGKGWADTKRYFDRLPGKAEHSVRAPVWSLSRHSAGMAVRFKTDASQIRARYTLLSPNVAMPHMPATGVSGLDLYARNQAGQWRWLGVTRPTGQTFEGELAAGIEPQLREYMVYLPLYNGVESLEIGVPQRAAFEPLAARGQKPIVFYGTSILHGACASRPGMASPAILGRRFDRPTINLGFSGNGRMEPEVGQLLAELDAAAYVIDCLPNMRTKPLCVPNRWCGSCAPLAPMPPSCWSKIAHPSDLGMMRQADVLEPVLRPLLDGR